MANINPSGIDLTTGQMRSLLSTDTLTDADGTALGGGVTLLSSQSGSAEDMTYTVPGGTLAVDDDMLLFFGTYDYTSGSPVMTPRYGGTAFGQTTALSASGHIFWGIIHRTGASAQDCGIDIAGQSDTVALSFNNATDTDLKIDMSTGSYVRGLTVILVAA
jgi:hypothetical protein